MTTVIIDSSNIQAKSFIEYTRSLPFATVIEEEKMSFEEDGVIFAICTCSCTCGN